MSSKFTCSFRCIDVVTVVGLLMLTVTIGQAAELNPAAVIYKLPDQIEWKGTGGNRSAVLVGDPEKPGLYVVINKWLAGNNFSRPHFHPMTVLVPCSRARGGSVPAISSILPIQCPCPQVPSSPISASRCTGMAPRTRMRFSLLWARAPRQAPG